MSTSPPRRFAPPRRQWQRWVWLAVLALLLHLPLLYALAWLDDGERSVRVIAMGPAPGTTVSVDAEGPLTIDLELDIGPDDPAPNPLGAQLLFIAPDGERELVAVGRVDEDDHAHLTFEAERREGRYQIWLASGGPTPLFAPAGGYILDGEPKPEGDDDDDEADPTSGADSGGGADAGSRLPSGDGEPGGDFVATIEVAPISPEPEIVVANLVEEKVEPVPEPEGVTEPVPEPPAPAIFEQPPEEAPRTSPEPSQRPSPKNSSPPTAEPDPTPPPLVENELPTREPKRPEKEAEVEDMFAVDGGDLEGIYGDEADAKAAALRDARKRDGPLGGWEEELERTKGAFTGDGPRVKPGNQQAVSTHRREVWAYIAAMHKIIHRQWADNYLINLDMTNRDPTDPINNPDIQTVLELELTESGEVNDVQIVSSSGIQTYDAEAIRIAFTAGPREPVPESMLSPNNKAYLHWAFHRDQRQCGTFGVELFVLTEEGAREDVELDQQKVRAEEERIGVRNQSGAQPGGRSGRTTAPAAPRTSPSPSPTRDGAQGDGDGRDAGDDDADEVEPQLRPQRRKRGLER